MIASLSIGIIVGVPLVSLLTLALSIAYLWARKHQRAMGRDEYDWDLWTAAKWGLFLALVGTVAGSLVGFYPYSGEYHEWRTTQGRIAVISSRFLGGSSNSVTQRFVVRFTDGRQRSCDDTRCALLHRGDLLTLACKRAWQFSGTDGYDCNYVRSSKDGS